MVLLPVIFCHLFFNHIEPIDWVGGGVIVLKQASKTNQIIIMCYDFKLFYYDFYRYRLYGNWKNETYAHHAKMIRVRAECLEKAKYIMK